MLYVQWSKRKSQSQILKELTKTCKVDGCDESLTHFKGPGESVLCRAHQLTLKEFGGAGRLNRLHTVHRTFICDECGKNIVDELNKKYPGLSETNPDLFNRLCRSRVIGDHKFRKADGGDDSLENIQTLCLDCNSDKTILCKDYEPSKSKS